MIDCQFCIHCTKKTVKLFSHMRKLKRIYVDEIGREWHGARCPDCYSAYKKKYDAARSLKKGRTPLGAICVCPSCGNQYELLKGWNTKLCKQCVKL